MLADDLIAAARQTVDDPGADSGPQSVLGYAHSLCVLWGEGGVTELSGEGAHRGEDFWAGHASRLTTLGRRDNSSAIHCGQAPTPPSKNLGLLINTSYAQEVLISQRSLVEQARLGAVRCAGAAS